METAILSLQCPDKPGLVATISQWVFQHDGNIVRLDQFSSDTSQRQYFMRLEFCYDKQKKSYQNLEKDFKSLATHIQATWSLHPKHKKMRMGILVSKHDHCLYEILYHKRSNDLQLEIPFIISNHPDCESLAQWHAIPFYHLPTDAKKKEYQEQQILDLVTDTTDFLVLARYMQILTPQFIKKYAKDIINIHHSFLPSFIGANPYRQAYERGVKLIGATAHYVTEDLDQGPIIEQNVERVYHHNTVDELKHKGQNLENTTLLKAIQAHTQHRAIRFGNKTIVFN